MSAPSARGNFSSGDLRLAEIKTYELDTPLLVPQSLPNLHFYLQPDDGHRIPLDHDPRYCLLRSLTKTILNHLVESDMVWVEIRRIISIILRSAQRTLGREFVTPDREDLQEFLLQNTPAVILNNLVRPRDPNNLSWGQVWKGDGEDAAKNEIFILRELADTLDSPPPSDLSAEQVALQRAYQQLLISVTLIHETVHAFTKYIFTPAFVTPDLPRLVSDGDGHGHSGATFEREYLHINLQAVWTRTNFLRPRRMWYIENLVSKFKGQSSILGGWKDSTEVNTLIPFQDPLFIATLQNSFLRSETFVPRSGALQQYNHDPDRFVRYRVGYDAQLPDDYDAEGVVLVDEKDFIMSTTCMPRDVV
ncbi:hypothetical protein C8R45DRAFT_954284 [Mycena sanguinolenta]|nr:hypothetical protein C8R45DRAFT_954284 [Mycena sanguinolenta]